MMCWTSVRLFYPSLCNCLFDGLLFTQKQHVGRALPSGTSVQVRGFPPCSRLAQRPAPAHGVRHN
jgi:hypothetical protein